MLRARIVGDQIRIGRHFGLSFQRTLRIPDDKRHYPLPPGLGDFPIRRVADYKDRVPESWRKHGGVFIPMYQREALWLSFEAPYWRPCAVQVAVGKVNAISGAVWEPGLSRAKQDYVVCPDQPWLDGIKAERNCIRQFVAMPLGMGYTVEEQVTGKAEFGGLQIVVYDPKPGRFPERPRERWGRMGTGGFSNVQCCYSVATEMGLGAGGRMRQKIYPDQHGIDTWDETNTGRLYVHIVNSMAYREITGEEPPATPISARTYARFGLPWFDLYDEEKGDVETSEILAGVKSVKKMDAEKGFTPQQDDATVEVPAAHVKTIAASEDGVPVEEGSW